MGKKTMNGVWIGLGLVLIAGIMIFGIASINKTTEQSAIQTSTDVATGVSSELLGKTSTVTVLCYDIEQDTSTRANSTVYAWVDGVYVGTDVCNNTEGATVSATVGQTVEVIAFDATYDYGTAQEFVVNSQALTKNVEVSLGATANGVTVVLFDENGNVLSAGGNVTVGTTAYTFDKFRIENTDDKSLSVLCGLGINFPTGTNASEVQLSGMTQAGVIPKRLKDTVDYWYEMDNIKLNDDNTRFETGTFKVVPDGDNIAIENMNVTIADCAPFLTVTNELGVGVQSDATNPTDVGRTDETLVISLL